MSEDLLWIEPNGTQHELTDPNTFLWTPGATGMWMPPIVYQGQEIPLISGEIPRLILHGPRDVLVPLHVKGVTRADLFNNLEEMCSMFVIATPTALGILRRTSPNGHIRDLNCFLLSGATGDESIDNYGMNFMVHVPALHAPDPYWYDSEPTIQTFTPAGLVGFFASPFLPIKLSPSGSSSAFSIINAGDVPTYPVWTISGICSNPVLTNTYTAANGATITKTLTLTISLTGGQVLTIITKPGSASIKLQDGSNQMSAISDFTSSLWALQPGVNQCGVALTSPGAGAQVVLNYKQAYLAP